ncbi:MAG: hypothetical protein PVI44_10405, partial [Balneolaceae bacterium]
RDLWSDSLEVKVLKKFQKIYKHKFIKMKHPELGIPAYIMVDKNKRIAIFTKGDEKVAVNYVDLSVNSEKAKEQ